MRRPSTPARATSLTLTATTLVALVAMGAGARGAPATSLSRVVRGEVALAWGEGDTVRAVAAAVAAVARDLLAGQNGSALATEWPLDDMAVETAAPAPRPAGTRPPRRPSLDERLLDLPPPAC